jgi:hypothetical protein
MLSDSGQDIGEIDQPVFEQPEHRTRNDQGHSSAMKNNLNDAQASTLLPVANSPVKEGFVNVVSLIVMGLTLVVVLFLLAKKAKAGPARLPLLLCREEIRKVKPTSDSRQGASTTRHYAVAHGYKDGDALTCARCGKGVRVKLHQPGGIVIATPRSLGERVCICDNCGKILYHPCTTTMGQLVPNCDLCGGMITLPCA